jgi:F-type H+-transporting ATPase subunit epsilon
MTVLAPAAEFPAEIDTTRAQNAKERAEKQMASLNPEEKEWEAAEVALKRALVRLQVASKEARR